MDSAVIYRACLAARGYVRAKTLEPAPAGSYRGRESGADFSERVNVELTRSR
jgi:hypothetical protein